MSRWIYETRVHPYASVVRVLVEHEDGRRSIGSGVVVGANDVLTAAHVVDDARDAARISVAPGYDRGQAPFGTLPAASVRWNPGYDRDGDGRLSDAEISDDFAVLAVDLPAGPRALPLRADALANGPMIGNFAGYPAALGDNEVMLHASGTIRERGDLLIGPDFPADMSGMSGGPIWTYADGRLHVVGLFVSDGDRQFYIDREDRDAIRRMTEANDPLVLHGGEGPDAFAGEALDDRLLGAGGADRLRGRDGDDALYGGPGRDSLRGDGGDDFILGEGGGDRARGGTGDDRVWGGAGGDALSGTAGADQVSGERGADRLRGGGGDDEVLGGPGGDRLWGGAGQDDLVGGEGRDRLRGGGGDDRLAGDEGRDALHGGGGDDDLAGMTGDDLLFGGDGNDRLFGNEGNDVLAGGPGVDRLFGGAGRDVFVFDVRAEGRAFIGAGDFAEGSDDFDPALDVLRFVGGPASVEDLALFGGVATTSFPKTRPVSSVIRYGDLEVVIFHAAAGVLEGAAYEFVA